MKGRKAEGAECRGTGGPRGPLLNCAALPLSLATPGHGRPPAHLSRKLRASSPHTHVFEFSSSHGCKTAAGRGEEVGVKARDCRAKGCLQEEREAVQTALCSDRLLYALHLLDGFARLFIRKKHVT